MAGEKMMTKNDNARGAIISDESDTVATKK